jgi:hypothetical protein
VNDDVMKLNSKRSMVHILNSTTVIDVIVIVIYVIDIQLEENNTFSSDKVTRMLS